MSFKSSHEPQQHLCLPNTSRLPTLVVTAAYAAGGVQLGERILPLKNHNAADKQTGTIGLMLICALCLVMDYPPTSVLFSHESRLNPIGIEPRSVKNSATYISRHYF